MQLSERNHNGVRGRSIEYAAAGGRDETEKIKTAGHTRSPRITRCIFFTAYANADVLAECAAGKQQ